MLILELIHTVLYYIALFISAFIKQMIIVFTGRTCKHCEYYNPRTKRCDIYMCTVHRCKPETCLKSFNKKHFKRAYYFKHAKKIGLNTIIIALLALLIWVVFYCILIIMY